MSAGRWFREQPRPSFKQLCVMAHHVFDRVGDDADPRDVTDELKWDCARAGFSYDTESLARATEAARCARDKGYRTPPIRTAPVRRFA